ncbi:MAG: RDD family protein [Formosimonas sp.]
MNNCWTILGINATQNLRDIKLAYAKLLKVTRPDQDPQGFARLHEAYQEAQWLAQSEWYWDEASANDAPNVTATEPPLVSTREKELLNHLLDEHTTIHIEQEKQSSIEIADDAQAFFRDMLLPNEWLAQLEYAIYAEKLTPLEWETLLKPAKQFDAETRTRATHIVLKRIYHWYLYDKERRSARHFWSDFQKAFENTGWDKSAMQNIAQQLDWWNTAHQEWRNEYDETFIWSLRYETSSEQEQHSWNEPIPKNYLETWQLLQGFQDATIGRRFAAKLIDTLIVVLCILAVQPLAPVPTQEHPEFAFIFWFSFAVLIFFLMLFLEQSPLQGTIGSYLLKIRMINAFGAKLTLQESGGYYISFACRLIVLLIPLLLLWSIVMAIYKFAFSPETGIICLILLTRLAFFGTKSSKLSNLLKVFFNVDDVRVVLR